MELIEQVGVGYFIQSIIESWSEVFLLIVLVAMQLSTRMHKAHPLMQQITIPYRREIMRFYLAVFFYNLADIVIIYTNQNTDWPAPLLLRLSIFVYYLIGEYMTLLLLHMVYRYILKNSRHGILTNLSRFFMLLQLPNLILLFLTPGTGSLYVFSGQNTYQRVGSGQTIWYLLTLSAFAFVTFVWIICRREIDLYVKTTIMICLVLPVAAFIGNRMISGCDFNNLAVIAIAMILYIIYEKYRTTYSAEMVQTIDRLQTKIALSQIQPHFLHNTLNSIIYYSDKDGQKTKQALIDFSRYLRNNLNAIQAEHPVQITEELEHTRQYLELEKLRFEEKLEVEWDIRDKDFSLPVLTVQPLVENAVRHGIRKSFSGKGKVRISTESISEAHKVVVSDTGIGFDPSVLNELNESHIGIANVRRRLERGCGGTLDIISEPGKGTDCVIRIPKTEAETSHHGGYGK